MGPKINDSEDPRKGMHGIWRYRIKKIWSVLLSSFQKQEEEATLKKEKMINWNILI